MILDGTNINTQSFHEVDNQGNLTISQLIKYNSVIRLHTFSQEGLFHPKERETSLQTYIGLLLH